MAFSIFKSAFEVAVPPERNFSPPRDNSLSDHQAMEFFFAPIETVYSFFFNIGVLSGAAKIRNTLFLEPTLDTEVQAYPRLLL